LDLLEGLQHLTDKQQLKNFELVIRISSKQKQRWDETFILRQLENISMQPKPLNRLWVCGPPVMNELFDRILEREGDRIKITRDVYDIL